MAILAIRCDACGREYSIEGQDDYAKSLIRSVLRTNRGDESEVFCIDCHDVLPQWSKYVEEQYAEVAANLDNKLKKEKRGFFTARIPDRARAGSDSSKTKNAPPKRSSTARRGRNTSTEDLNAA